MDKLDYALLDIMMNDCKATTKMSAETRKAIVLKFDAKEDAVYRRLKKLMEKGYVENGFTEGNEHTYFITESGINALNEALK